MKKNKLFCILASLTMLVAAGVHVSHNAGYVNTVEAEEVTEQGLVTSMKTSEDGKTRTWDYSGGTNETDKYDLNGSTDNGIVYYATKADQIRHYTDGYLSHKSGGGSAMYVPVPAGSAGAITFLDTNTKTDRYTILTVDGVASDKWMYPNKDTGYTINFDAGDITEYNSATYLHFVNGSGEMKTKKITVVLSLMSYIESGEKVDKVAVNYNHNYEGSENYVSSTSDFGYVINDYKPTREGYSFVGWYTESTCENEFDFSKVYTKEVTLYAKWMELFNVTYHLDKTNSETVQLAFGDKIEYAPSSESYGFGGWYFDEALTDAVPADYVISKSVDLYAKWIELSYSIDPSNLTEEAATDVLAKKVVHFQNTIFTLTPGIKIDSSSIDLPDGTTSTHRLNMGGSSKWTEGNSQQRTIEFTAPSDGTLTVAFTSGTAGRKLQIRENETQVLEQAHPEANVIEVATLEVKEGKFYQVGAGANIYLYQVTFTPKAAEVAPAATMNYQYDNEANPTAVRFIGTIANVDYQTINSVTLHFVKEGVAASKDIYITTLYTAVANTEFGEATNTYYVVYVLNGVQSVLDQELEVTMTVTFNNGNEALTATRSFTLGE